MAGDGSESHRSRRSIGSSRQKSSSSLKRSESRLGSSKAPGPSVLEPHPEEDEESGWGIGTFFWYLLGGGQQCCYRSTGGPDDPAARRAAETGRPPASAFPAPLKEKGPPVGSREKPPSMPPSAREKPAPAPSSKYQAMEESESDSEFEKYPPLQPTSAPQASKGSAFSSQKGSSELPPRGGSETSQPQFPPPGRASLGRTSLKNPPSKADTSASLDLSISSSTPALQEVTASSNQGLRRWQWPPWCLNFKSPCIEVYVIDEETHIGRWVEAEPQSRVVDKSGKDAYLCVEYEWEGEYYFQDFGPQHVRKRGAIQTVFETFESSFSG